MDHTAAIREIAGKLGLLDDTGELNELDSLTTLDFHASLEETLNVVIPPEVATLENFKSIGAIDAMLRSLAEEAGRSA